MKNTLEEDILKLKYALTKFAFSLTNDRELAKDLVQETFFRAFRNINKFKEGTNLKAWLFTIMKNEHINYGIRSAKYDKTLDAEKRAFIINNKKSHNIPDSDINYKELKNMVNSLEPEYRIPFQMMDSGYNYQEIAQELGLTLSTVKNRIRASRTKLKREYKKDHKEKAAKSLK